MNSFIKSVEYAITNSYKELGVSSLFQIKKKLLEVRRTLSFTKFLQLPMSTCYNGCMVNNNNSTPLHFHRIIVKFCPELEVLQGAYI